MIYQGIEYSETLLKRAWISQFYWLKAWFFLKQFSSFY